MIMQVLVMQLAKDHYALETREVVRVLPMVPLTVLPRAPHFIAGIMNYQGVPVPVLDLAVIAASAGAETDTMPSAAAGRRPDPSFDTRILLVEQVLPDGSRRLLGLMAEHVTGTRDIDPAWIAASGVHDPGSRFLGRLVAGVQPMLQLVAPRHLLPAHVARWLYDALPEIPC